MILFTSESTRRRELLQQIGFRVVHHQEREIREDDDIVQKDAPVYFDYHKEKDFLALDEAKQMAIEVARRKVSRAVDDLKDLTTLGLPPGETAVAGADTVVYFNGRVLDRPLLVMPSLANPGQIMEAEDTAR